MQRKWMLFITTLLLLIGLSNQWLAIPFASAQEPEIKDQRPLGIANASILAHYHPDLPSICAIQAGESLLAVGQSSGDDDGGDVDYYAVYAGSAECEGRVWIEAEAPVSWQNSDTLADLPMIDPPSSSEAIVDLPDYAEVCALATADDTPQAESDTATWQTVYMPGAWSFFPTQFVATEAQGVDALICITPQESALGTCPDLSVEVELVREDALVTLMDYETQSIIAQELFNGTAPLTCPFTALADATLRGDPPLRSTWAAWVIGQLVGAERNMGSLRTLTTVGQMNARAEATTNSQIIALIPQGSYVNLVARNESGTWALALLPDMTQVWLYVELLQVAVQTDVMALPLAEGRAAEIVISDLS